MTIELESKGRFGNALTEATIKKGLTLAKLAAATGGTYEHMRKLAKGLAYPSKYLLRDICKVLDADFAHMERLVVEDKLTSKFGTTYHNIVGRDSDAADFDELIPYLTPEQRKMFLTQMRAVVRGNRRH